MTEMKPAPKKSVALSGVVAGNTALCTRRPHAATTCTTAATTSSTSPSTCEFEEIAHLLVHGSLPTRAELADYKAKLKSLRGLPRAVLKQRSKRLPAAAHPMDVMRTGVSALGCVLPEKETTTPPGARDIADRLMASLGSMLLYWYHYAHQRPPHRGRDRRRFDRRRISCTCCTASRRRRRIGARDAHLAQSLRRARVQRLDLHRARRSPAPAPTSIRRSPARSARCAGRSMAAPTRSRSRCRSATPTRTRPKPTSAAGSRQRKS